MKLGYEEYPMYVRNKKMQEKEKPELTVAIGDIHGCYDQLLQLMFHVQHWTAYKKTRYVFLGDYTDRGPDSKSVIEFLKNFDNRFIKDYDGIEHQFLRGNHDDMFLGKSPNFQKGKHDGYANWMQNGGNKTLESYGFNFDDFYKGCLTSDNVVERFEKAYSVIPPEHIDWLNKTSLFYKDDMRTYVHAGILRGTPITEQTEFVLTWIRDQFLHDPSMEGGYIVHGHTSRWAVEVRENRCNVDTACVYGGVLSAAIFDDKQTKPVKLVNHKGIWSDV